MAGHDKENVNVSVSTLITKGNQVLLEKRQHAHGAGTWGPPTGHPEFGEGPEQTAIRETKEETGVTISDVKFRAVTNNVFEAEHEHHVTIWMEAMHVSGEPRLAAPKEESEVSWFAWDTLPEPLFPPFAHLIEGKTYPSSNAKDTIGAAVEIPDIPVAETVEPDTK